MGHAVKLRCRMRTGAALVSVVGLIAWAWVASGCRRTQGSGGDGGATAQSAPTERLPDKAAGEEVIALFGGLRQGDVIAGYTVEQIGAVRGDGGVPVRLSREGATMRLVVTLAPEGEDPRPPARTDRYAVYYESGHDGVSAREQDCQRAAEELAERIRAQEGTVPVPAGMKAPRKVGQPS